MEEKTKLKSWKETISYNYRALSIFYKRSPKTVISRIICTVWNALTPYISIYFSALIINELTGERNINRIKVLVIITLCTSAVTALIGAMLNKWKNTYNSGLWYDFKHIFAEKRLDMDYADLDSTYAAQLHSTIEQNNNSSGWGILKVLRGCESMLSALFTVAGGISLTVSLFILPVPESSGRYTVLNNPLFILAVVAVMLAITYIAPVLTTKSESYWAVNTSLTNANNRRFSFFGFLGHRKDIATDVRIYGQEKICNNMNNNKNSSFGSNSFFAKLAKGPMGLYAAASSAVSVIFTGFVYVFVCLKAWAGAFGLGSVTQYISAITKLSGGLSNLIATLGDMRNNATFMECNFEYLDIPNKMYMGSLTVEKRRDRKYEIEFKNVSFKYPNSKAYALKNINVKFEIGKRLAVVGMNGSGKTTFIKLLCRLYDPTEGEILLNGIDIRKYRYEEYMQIFSVVFQDFKLFSLQLGENVAGKTQYDHALAEDCLKKAGFEDRLATLPDGLDTYLYTDCNKNGISVSGGEAQKIAIARSLYKDAPFIILDEPTAALDPIAEAEIYSKFDSIVGDKTAIYISHRLSSCKFCDEILVFHKGDVVQHGRHNILLENTNGKYYELWSAQAQYYTK